MTLLDRRLSVAPMMDWTDDQKIYRCINNLG
jgi:tRNA-dihydrouridine synthase